MSASCQVLTLLQNPVKEARRIESRRNVGQATAGVKTATNMESTRGDYDVEMASFGRQRGRAWPRRLDIFLCVLGLSLAVLLVTIGFLASIGNAYGPKPLHRARVAVNASAILASRPNKTSAVEQQEATPTTPTPSWTPAAEVLRWLAGPWINNRTLFDYPWKRMGYNNESYKLFMQGKIDLDEFQGGPWNDTDFDYDYEYDYDYDYAD